MNLQHITKTIYITKYALTNGILTAKAISINAGGYATINLASYDFRYIKYPNSTQVMSNKDWYHTMEEAVEVANKMRMKKVETVLKQLEKLSKSITIDDIVPMIKVNK